VLTDGCRVIIQLPHRYRGQSGFAGPANTNSMREKVAASLACASIALAGCATSVDGLAVLEKSAPPPVSVAALDGLLLRPDEVKQLTATGVSGNELRTSMLDDSDNIVEKSCAAVDNATEIRVYAGSGWTAVRRQQFAEPGDDRAHFVQQAVVSFPTTRDAADFFTASLRLWVDCSNRRYRHTESGEPDLVWTVSPISNVDAILSTTKTQEGADGWNCQRALTTGNNVVVDVVACSYNQADTAIDIARQIRAKLPK
jgi:hypothetical protein